MKIGIIICDRYRGCAGGKCFRAVRERQGGFARYPAEEPLEVVGFTSCGGCPGGNVEYAPEEMLKNGAETIHLATGFVVGYPPCPSTEYFQGLHRDPVRSPGRRRDPPDPREVPGRPREADIDAGARIGGRGHGHRERAPGVRLSGLSGIGVTRRSARA